MPSSRIRAIGIAADRREHGSLAEPATAQGEEQAGGLRRAMVVYCVDAARDGQIAEAERDLARVVIDLRLGKVPRDDIAQQCIVHLLRVQVTRHAASVRHPARL